jgi:NAD(P)-dependent dehydrogenase (short-subunit alcohol dehydrogenase family)
VSESLKNFYGGKTAIVTGAASGIGREIARQLAAEGAIVLLTDVSDSVHEAADQMTGSVTSMIVDVSDRDQIAAAINQVVAAHGRLDLIFNNAGVAIFGEYEELTLDDWDKSIDVNLRGVAYGSKLAYDQMLKQGSGNIVNTASVAGLVPVPLQTHYVATKHALVGLGKTLRLEADRHGIGVTTYCPAFVESGMFENNTFKGTMEGTDARKLVPIKPLATDKAVRPLLEGVAKNKAIVVVPFYGRLGWWLERFAPPLAGAQHRLLYAQTVKRARKQKSRG